MKTKEKIALAGVTLLVAGGIAIGTGGDSTVTEAAVKKVGDKYEVTTEVVNQVKREDIVGQIQSLQEGIVALQAYCDENMQGVNARIAELEALLSQIDKL